MTKLHSTILLLKIISWAGVALTSLTSTAQTSLRVGTFVVDATPPIGSPLAYQACDRVAMPLTARGIVLLTDDQPIVLCAVDWIGIANDGYQQWRQAIANAVGTTVQRVSVHALHQHDAPVCDLSAETMLAYRGLGGILFDVPFVRKTIQKVATAARDLVWLRRCQAGDTIDITCLKLGSARILHLPGEAVIEYQLAAQKMQPEHFVAVAAYGEYAPGYICLKEHYQQGGYEDSPRASKVAPEVEDVLMPAMETAMQ
jgi:hypothetical protein